MRTFLAYSLVLFLSPAIAGWGAALAGFPVALILSWTSMGLRTKVAGYIGGVCGVIASAWATQLLFHSLTGPASFTLLPFLAWLSILTCLIARFAALNWRIAKARRELLDTIAERGPDTLRLMSEETKTAHFSTLVGQLFGVAIVSIWFFCR